MPIILHDFNMEKIYNWFVSLRLVLINFLDFIVPLILIALYMAYSSYQHQTRMELIHQPKVNDFYFIDYHAINTKSIK